MNSSSDLRRVRTRGRVLRGAPVDLSCATAQYADLTGVSSATLDPARIETAVTAGYRDGFTEGHAAGLAAGHVDACDHAAVTAAHITSVLDRLAAAATATASHEAEILRAAEDAIAIAAVRLAEVIIGRELAVSSSPGTDALARVLGIAPAGGHVVVRLHPDDMRAIESDDTLTVDERVRMVPDASLSRGDAVADWGDTLLDARIASALDRAARALAGELPS